MRLENKKGKILAVAWLAAVLVFGFVIVPALMANPPETANIENAASETDSSAEPDTVAGDTEPGSDSGSGLDPAKGEQEHTVVITSYPSDESEITYVPNCFPGVNEISWEQAFESATSILANYGYEVDIPDPLDISNKDFLKGFHIYYHSLDDPIYDPFCNVYLRYDHEVPGEINIQEYMESEAFKGMSEAEIREIIDSDDLSHIEYRINTEHPKFKVLDGESCTIYFCIELNALTGEALRGWETRVRYGEELRFPEARYFGTPIWD